MASTYNDIKGSIAGNRLSPNNSDLVVSYRSARVEKFHTNKVVLSENYIYISHLDEGLQYWRLPTDPESISDTMQSTFSENTALGRTAPVYTYSRSGPRTVQIELTFHRDMMDDVNMSWSNSKLGYGEDYVDNLIHALQAIALPKYNIESNKAIEPPLVALRLSNEVFIKGVVNGSIGVTYKKPILSNGKYAQVSLSITISEVDPYDSTEVYKNGSFRGVVSTLKKGMGLEDDD